MAENDHPLARPFVPRVSESRDIVDILKELHVALGNSLGNVQPLAADLEVEEKKVKKSASSKALKAEPLNQLELLFTLDQQIDELDSAFENIAAQDLVRKICKKARRSLQEVVKFLDKDKDSIQHEQHRREEARKVYAKVWTEMQFLARFLCDVQPLGTTTRNFYNTTMRRHKGIGFVDPVYTCLPFGDMAGKNIMWLPSMLLEYLQEYTEFMKYFLKRGIQLLESEQNYLRDKYNNIATIATFFSSITASTLQFSFSDGTSTLFIVVNTLWFLSLVSSIASAANALLAITWHKSLSHAVRQLQSSMMSANQENDELKREKKRTKTLDRWFDSCPMAFLVASGALFMVGLTIFSFASSQHMVTSIMVLTLVSCHALCTSRLFVELLTVRWGELKGYVEKPINSSFSTFLSALLMLLRIASAPLFFIFDLFSLKGWKFLDTIGDKIRNLFGILTS